MSNLSDIGFPAKGDEEINAMIMSVLEDAVDIKCDGGFYVRYSDPSGAELYLQGNEGQEMIGFNPHFAGESRRTLSLLRGIPRETSELDGAYHASAEGGHQLVFDVPDFRATMVGEFPSEALVQLTAFGSNDFKLLKDEAELAAHHPANSWEPSRFVPPGLAELVADPATDFGLLRPVAKITGTVRDWELKANLINGNRFYWLLVETEGGEVDVVIDPQYVDREPVNGDIVAGHFWMSGKLLGEAVSSRQ
jgi:hypothetical protein